MSILSKVLFGKGTAKAHLSKALSAYGPNVMLAYGGSVIDCCKVISAQAVLDEDIWDMELVSTGFPLYCPSPWVQWSQPPLCCAGPGLYHVGPLLPSDFRDLRHLEPRHGNLLWQG